MIEVRNSVSVTQSLAVSASSKGAVDAQKASGKTLPPATGNVDETSKDQKPKASETVKVELESAVATINEYVQSIQRDLHFSVDEELKQTVIKVVDADSGETIRQIPEEVFLELARNLKEDGELRLMNALG